MDLKGERTTAERTDVLARRRHIVQHTAGALFREEVKFVGHRDPCMSQPVSVARPDDAWANQMVGVHASRYVEAMVLGVWGLDASRVALGLPQAS